ncbi:MAG: carbohydrate kinase family protein [Nitrososphaerales archaeon]
MLQNLQKRIKSLKPVVVMHDFFIDRIVQLNDLDSLLDAASAKIESGGGSIRGIEQTEIKGGNAVNVAYALAKLGAKTSLITIADSYGSGILKNAFLPFKDSKLIVKNGTQGYTISLEVSKNKGKANVMISDVGDTGNFGADRLGKRELSLIQSAPAVMITNWASNMKGTELALKAFKTSKKDALCFLDPADISTRRDDFKNSLMKLGVHLDILSINENECRLLLQSLTLGPLPMGYSSEDVGDAAKKLAEKLSITVDVHTPRGAATSTGSETVFVQSFDVGVRITTGAGDVWDAADVIGYLCKLDASDRLLFANACSALYVSSEDASAPALKEVLAFISKNQ